MPRVLNCGVIAASKIVVISVFRQIQAIADFSVDGIVCIAIEIEEAGMLVYTMAGTVFTEVVPIGRVIAVVAFFHISKPCVTVSQRVKIVLFAVNRIPFFLYEGWPIEILGSLVGRQPLSLQQLSSVKCVCHICEERPALAIQSFEGFLVEVVVAVVAIHIRQIPPSGLGRAVDDVIPCAIHFCQSRDLALAGAGRFIELVEILVAFVVESGNLVNALQGTVVNEIVGCTVDRLPAEPGAVVQNEPVCELLIRFAVEMAAARVRGIFRFLIGINPILLLERGLIRHAVKRVRTQIDVVADRTGVRDAQALLRIPLCAVLGGHLHTAENTDGVGRIRVDGLALLDEIALHGKRVVFIHGRRGQAKVIVGYGQIGNVHMDILVKLELHDHFGFRADTLCQLEQQIPGRDSGNVAAGYHGQQRLQFLRHLDRHHVQSEDIGDIHGLGGVDHMIAVCLAVAAGEILRIGNVSRPREGSVAACGVVKVENRLIGAVHGDLDRGADGVVPGDHGRDGHIAQAGRLAAGKGKAAVRSFHCTCRAAAQLKGDVAGTHSDRIFIVGCDQGKAHRIPIDSIDARLGEFQAVRLDYGERLAADHRITGQELDLHAALLDSGENALLGDGADGFIRGFPCEVGRKLCGTAGHTDSGSDQANRGAARQIIVSSGDQGMVKLPGNGSRGNDHQRGADGALITVRRTVHDRKRIAAFLLRHEGGGTAAVQIDRGHTACIQHDLCQFLRVAAGGEGLLAAIQHHQDNLALCGDTNAGAGMAFAIIIRSVFRNGFSVLYKKRAAANGLLNLISIGAVFTGAADYSGPIFQNCKEAFRTNAMVFNALHDKSTAGSAGGHVVEVRIDADYRIVVLHIVFRVRRIGVPLLRRSHLIRYPGHRPALRGIIGVVVCIDAHIIP